MLKKAWIPDDIPIKLKDSPWDKALKKTEQACIAEV